jgi:hypothetical protein
MRIVGHLLLWIPLLLTVACLETEGPTSTHARDERLTGLRHTDITCGNLHLDGHTLAFASQVLDEGVFEVLIEINGNIVDWMGDDSLGIEALNVEAKPLNEQELKDLRSLHEALDQWFEESPQTVSLHEELLLAAIERLTGDDSLHHGQISPWSLSTPNP